MFLMLSTKLCPLLAFPSLVTLSVFVAFLKFVVFFSLDTISLLKTKNSHLKKSLSDLTIKEHDEAPAEVWILLLTVEYNPIAISS